MEKDVSTEDREFGPRSPGSMLRLGCSDGGLGEGWSGVEGFKLSGGFKGPLVALDEAGYVFENESSLLGSEEEDS